jgi:hypothetical protein
VRGDVHAGPPGPETAQAAGDEAHQDVDGHHRAAVCLEQLIVRAKGDQNSDDDQHRHHHFELAAEVGHGAVTDIAGNFLHAWVAGVRLHHVAAVLRRHD